MSFTYLAAPYSHPLPAVRELRYAQTNAFAARLMMQGEPVFSPISQSHEIARYMGERFIMDHDFWMNMDLPMLAKARRMWVLCLDGWEDSRGVQAEMKFAASAGIPIFLVHPSTASHVVGPVL